MTGSASLRTQALAVTGANGFLGRHLTMFARAQGRDVAGVVRSPSAARVVIEAGGRPVVVPALDPEPLTGAVKDCGAVVHLAGISAERAGNTYEGVNLQGMRSVLAAAQAAGVPRVIFFSGLGVARYGISRRSTNGYFLAKLAAEVELFRSGLEAVVFRPSYIVGPGDELIPALLREMEAGEIERVGDGSYRLQPIAVKDVAEAILAAAERPLARHTVIDLVGPEPLTYRDFVERVARAARPVDLQAEYRIREVSMEDADRQAAAGGYRGLLPDELDVLLCDEVSDPRPLESLLGRFLTPLDEALSTAVTGSSPRPSPSFRR